MKGKLASTGGVGIDAIAIVSLGSFTVRSLFLLCVSGRNLNQGIQRICAARSSVGCCCFEPETTAENAAENEELSTENGLPSLLSWGDWIAEPCVTRISSICSERAI